MLVKSYDLHGVRILEYSEVQDAVSLIGEAIGHSASVVAVPAEKLDPNFFILRSGLAGEFIQKFATYRLKLAIIGDFSELASRSASLRDFIYEANRGNSVWFVRTMEELEARLAPLSE